MPDDGKQDSIVTAALRDRRHRPWPLIGVGLVAAAGAMLLSTVSLWPHGDAWVFLLIAGAAILWITRYGVAGGVAADATDAARPMPPRSPPRTRAACGACCAGSGSRSPRSSCCC